MKKVPMIILLLAPYVFLLICIGICMAEKGFTADAIEMIGWTFLGMFLLILFPNMIYAFILKRFGYGHRKLFFWNMLIPFLVIFDYLLLLPSTMYGVSGLRSLSKTGKASKAGIMINGICQFLFVFDVISAAYLYIRFRKSY
ncbi:hypothetical protein H6B07_09740 [Mediterraneibacter glycyrrhizinilyticus]|nr:hypothetical protein [Mediterraneibacter glycyrrhizinilyticus]MBM6802937.1 hypothetical protein [Mediterraneibacter glycyrrhizinilyticus]